MRMVDTDPFMGHQLMNAVMGSILDLGVSVLMAGMILETRSDGPTHAPLSKLRQWASNENLISAKSRNRQEY